MAEPDPTSDESMLQYYEACARFFQVVSLSPAQMNTLIAEIRRLRGMVEHLAARVAAQSELLAQRAEKKGGLQ